MKKFAIGCLIVLVVVGVGGSIAAYHYLWKPAKAAVTEIAKLKEVPQMNQQVRKTTPFTPPPGNALSKDTVDRFLRTQEAMNTRLGQRANELSEKYRLLEQNLGRNHKPTWPELVTAYKDFAGLLLEAKRVQVDALNHHDYSVEEYAWTRQRVYEAAGIPVSFDFEKMLNAILQGNTSKEDLERAMKVTSDQPVPDTNRALVEPFKQQLIDRVGLVAFGL